jgi:hypothetical protein
MRRTSKLVGNTFEQDAQAKHFCEPENNPLLLLEKENPKVPKEMAKGKKHYKEELQESVQQSNEPVGKVLTNFCHRHGISMAECKTYYDELVTEGKVKEEQPKEKNREKK